MLVIMLVKTNPPSMKAGYGPALVVFLLLCRPRPYHIGSIGICPINLNRNVGQINGLSLEYNTFTITVTVVSTVTQMLDFPAECGTVDMQASY